MTTVPEQHEFEPSTDLTAICKKCRRRYTMYALACATVPMVCRPAPVTGARAQLTVTDSTGKVTVLKDFEEIQYEVRHDKDDATRWRFKPASCECGAYKTYGSGVGDSAHASYCPWSQK